MLAFIDSPVQIAVVMVVVLLVFGPDKMRDIGKQLGRAMREIRRVGSDFRNTLDGDDYHHDPDHNPPRYDSYGNITDSRSDYSASYDVASVSEQDLHPAGQGALPAGTEPEHRGDFAAAALSDSASDYGVEHAPPPPADPAPPSGSSAPVYGVLATPEQSVPREKTAARP